jgi:hypothetical protein
MTTQSTLNAQDEPLDPERKVSVGITYLSGPSKHWEKHIVLPVTKGDVEKARKAYGIRLITAAQRDQKMKDLYTAKKAPAARFVRVRRLVAAIGRWRGRPLAARRSV